MDEQRLADALREAVGPTPPPSFGYADVVRASARITARRRCALAGGALALLVVAGVGMATGLPVGRPTGPAPPAATAPAPPAAAAAPPLAAPAPQQPESAGRAEQQAAPRASAPQADGPSPPAAGSQLGAPLGPGDPSTCADQQDRRLRRLVEQVLPEVVGAAQASTTRECRPGGERAVAVELGRGVLGVRYLPPGGWPATGPAVGPGTASAPTASGGTVVVAFSGAGGPGDRRLAEAAERLAPLL